MPSRQRLLRRENLKYIRQHMLTPMLAKICAGKIKDPSGLKRKDFRGPKKAEGGLMGELNRPNRGYKSGGFIARGCGKIMSNRRKKTKMR